MENEIIHISLLGDFKITYKGVSIDVAAALGKKLVNLLEVFIMNLGREVTSYSLYDMFWENSEDPRNSLKYSIFRLRKGLEDIEVLKDLDLIKTCEDGYMLSNEYEYEIDINVFDDLYDQLRHVTDPEANDFAIGKRIVELYKGRLYTNNRSAMITTMEAERYSSQFATSVVLMSRYLLKKNRLDEMMKLNYDAILIEPFYEGLHYYYMKGLIEVKNYHRALQYYDEINERFYNELGTGLSPQFRVLYDAIKEEDAREEKEDIKSFKSEVEADQQPTGGFFVTYDMFKYIYELTLKGAKRDGKNCYLLMLTIGGNITIEEKVSISNRIKAIISDSIRSNDVFTRINKNQFVALLMCKEMDNVHMVAQRITSKFYKRYSQKKYRLSYSVEEAIEGKLS